MSRKKTIFVSYCYEDTAAIQLLKGQLASDTEIDFLISNETPTSSGAISTVVDSQLDQSSMMLAMLGESWSKWQEYELRSALERKVPVVGIRLNKSIDINSPILDSGDVPIVNWSWDELQKVLSGDGHSLDYKAPADGALESPIIQLDFSKISEELTDYILNNPEFLHNIDPRRFEELVAYIMEKHGYEVTLTQQSRDGGIDIFALKNEGFGNILTIVDCKKYSETNPVRLGAVRNMYGTLQIENASHGIIATTSRFTRDARRLAKEYEYQLSLKNHADILRWIQDTKT